MKVKSMLAIIVTNIFLLMAVTIMYEYINLTERFNQLDDVIKLSFESAVDTVINADEVFSEKSSSHAASAVYGGGRYAITSEGTEDNTADGTMVQTGTLIIVDGELCHVNPYCLAMYYRDYSRIPRTAAEFAQFKTNYNGKTTAQIFSFLYGTPGIGIYSNSWLSSANAVSRYTEVSEPTTWRNLLGVTTAPTVRVPTTEFRRFYNSIGSSMIRHGSLRVKNGGSFYMQEMDYRILDQMGLDFGGSDSIYTGNNSQMGNQNFVNSLKIGKRRTKSGVPVNTIYFLTPNALGVTYVPLSVLKPVTLATLESNVQLKLLESNDLSDVNSLKSVLRQGEGCISTGIYDLATNTTREHEGHFGEDIINDGNVEYDLNTVKVKVDYFMVNLFGIYGGTAYDVYTMPRELVTIGTRVLGARPYTGGSLSHTLASTITQYRETSTGRVVASNQDYGDRLIARCSIRMKVHVPYKNRIFQLVRYGNGDTGHYDIKLWNPTLGSVDTSEDGLWYEYVTYRCVAQ